MLRDGMKDHMVGWSEAYAPRNENQVGVEDCIFDLYRMNCSNMRWIKMKDRMGNYHKGEAWKP